jgi:hypothetical protein
MSVLYSIARWDVAELCRPRDLVAISRPRDFACHLAILQRREEQRTEPGAEMVGICRGGLGGG